MQYQFYDNIKITKSNISRDIGMINPSINHHDVKHNSGIYRGAYRREQLYFCSTLLLSLVPSFLLDVTILYGKIEALTIKKLTTTLVASKTEDGSDGVRINGLMR